MLWVAALAISMSSQYAMIDPGLSSAVSYAYASKIDITSDSSITRYVWPDEPLQFLRYKPADLVSLTESPFIEVRGWVGYLRREAFDQLADMAFHFHQIFKKRLVVVSSFRTFGVQLALFQGYTESHGLAAAGFSALPGHSEHQLGLATDLFTANTADADGYNGYYDRLQKNAYKRWFAQSYKNGRKTDGYIVEPWHRRYLGIPLATWLHLNDLTFAEWVNKYSIHVSLVVEHH